jgi:AbrB family looped-hinge helix DNA binding protein
MSKMMAKITSKGQLTIPKQIREALGVKPGDRILFSIEEGKTFIYPVRGTLLDLRGSLKPTKTPEDLQNVGEEVKKRVARRVADEGLH